MHKYNPRGIIKWAPFNALSKYDQEIKALFNEYDKVDYKIDPEKLEYISETLYKALETKEQLIINFIDNDVLIEIQAKIIEITNENIITDEAEIPINSIYDIF